MLGIVIGIGSVILLMSIGTSAQMLIINQVQGIGSNLVFIIPGGSGKSKLASPASVQGIIIKTLVKEDLDAFKREPSIDYAVPAIRGQAKAVYGNNDTTVSYEGTLSEFFVMRNLKFAQGQAFTNSDVETGSKVAVLGSEISKTLFGDLNPIGKIIRLKDTSFRVVGVLVKEGVGPFGIDMDNWIGIPATVAQKQMLGIDYYNSITLQVNDKYDTEFAKSRITSVLRQDHHITDPDKDDFTIRTQEDALALLGSITSILKIFLAAIASISLVVGGIGIMNIMLVSVVERTKEIGLRKAVGATNKDIMSQFLWEAVMLTGLGGILGILGGAGVTGLVYLILKNFTDIGWVFALPISSILLAFGVSTLIGLAFGIYPARQAAKKSPIEALRYE